MKYSGFFHISPVTWLDFNSNVSFSIVIALIRTGVRQAVLLTLHCCSFYYIADFKIPNFSTVMLHCFLLNGLITWLIDWLIGRLIDRFLDWLIRWFVDSLIGWLVVRLIDWLLDSLVDWMIDRSIDWLINLRLKAASTNYNDLPLQQSGLACLLLEPSAARRKHSKSTLLVKNLSVAECSMRQSYRKRTSDTRMLCDAGNVPIAPRSFTMNQLCWWKICLSRSAQWDKVIEIEPAIHACYATQGTCLSRLVALPWISKDISLHHCATDVRLYVWPYRIFLVTQTTNRVLGSSFLAKRSLCSLVLSAIVGRVFVQ